MPDNKYDAFISYRRSDGAAVARWLRRELVGFRAPRSLRDRFDRRLKVYLDTAYERGTSDFYEQTIKPALLSSSCLLVVATPDAVRRAHGVEDWIAREIADFAAGPHGNNIIAIRGAGEFADPLPGDLLTRFPNIEIVDLRGAGRFWHFNPARAVHLAAEKLKVVAPLLDIPHEDMPKLRQEEERRQQFRIGSAIGGTLGVLVAVSGLSVYALQSRNQAIRSLDDSMFATGSMVLLSAGLEDGSNVANARTRKLLVNQGCDLIDKLGSSSGRKPPIGEIVTCRLERARSRDALDEQVQARALYEEAIALAAARYAATARADAGIRLVQARQAYAEYLIRQKNDAGAEAEYAKLLGDARRLGDADKYRPEFARAQGEALGRLGDLFVASGDHAKAGDSFDQAAEAVSREIDLEGDKPVQLDVEWLARLYRLAGEQHKQSGDADGAVERFNRALKAQSLLAANRITPSLDQEAATTHARILDLEQTRGNGAPAEKAGTAGLAAVERVLTARSASNKLKQQAALLKNWLEKKMGGR